jgi:hypothetical protein
MHLRRERHEIKAAFPGLTDARLTTTEYKLKEIAEIALKEYLWLENSEIRYADNWLQSVPGEEGFTNAGYEKYLQKLRVRAAKSCEKIFKFGGEYEITRERAKQLMNAVDAQLEGLTDDTFAKPKTVFEAQ